MRSTLSGQSAVRCQMRAAVILRQTVLMHIKEMAVGIYPSTERLEVVMIADDIPINEHVTTRYLW